MTADQTKPKIDRTKIQIPTVNFTKRAIVELKLIMENDFTLAGKYFRLLISGKGCDGFTYSVGFTDMNQDDFLVNIENHDKEQIVIDPFAAFYLNNVTVDFIQDPAKDLEGFVIINNQHKDYQGKFFNKDQSKLPPMMNLSGVKNA
jgi:Fe-S cluster assembly iron-binding protein IscA